MSNTLTDLEAVLRLMLTEHHRLLEQLDLQQFAMKAFDLSTLTSASQQQESCRTRLLSLDTRRRVLASQLSRELRIEGEVTLSTLASLHPARAAGLRQLRAELRETIEAIRLRTTVSARLAGAVLGHVNTALRILAGAMQRAGLYTRQGSPNLGKRIGVIEAVG